MMIEEDTVEEEEDTEVVVVVVSMMFDVVLCLFVREGYLFLEFHAEI